MVPLPPPQASAGAWVFAADELPPLPSRGKPPSKPKRAVARGPLSAERSIDAATPPKAPTVSAKGGTARATDDDLTGLWSRR